MKGLVITALVSSYLFFQPLYLFAQKENKVDWRKIKVLVYTKNGKGFVHDNIPFAVDCIKNLSNEHGFAADVSDTPTVFTNENLKQYHLLIFTSTNNDVFDTDKQRLSFRRYIEAGGGFVGVHSVMGTERNWKWFKQMLGGTFNMHAHFQRYEVDVIDPSHPSVKDVPLVWLREDECYFSKEMYPGIHTVMVQNVATLQPWNEDEAQRIKNSLGSFAELYPAVWHQNFDGGVIWITTLGHDKKDYSESVFVNHLFQGIRYVAGSVTNKDYTKAYADSRDTPLRFGNN